MFETCGKYYIENTNQSDVYINKYKGKFSYTPSNILNFLCSDQILKTHNQTLSKNLNNVKSRNIFDDLNQYVHNDIGNITIEFIGLAAGELRPFIYYVLEDKFHNNRK